MKRLVFIVEGSSEVQFINKLVIPYLSSLGFSNCSAQTIISNRKKHAKGGVQSYLRLKNDIERTLAQGNVIVTTLIDFFKLPTNFPKHTTDSAQINEMEKAIALDFTGNPDVIPYIQKHEFEAVLFSSIKGFESVIDDEAKLSKIQTIIDTFTNPEDINNSPETAPSKRCERIFSYSKVVDSNLIIEQMNVEMILDKCPRFSKWMGKLISRLNVTK